MMDNIYIGIDPGQQGAIAVLLTPTHHEVHDMPYDDKVDVLKIAEYIWPLGQDVIDRNRIQVFIEKSMMHRGQNVGSGGVYLKEYGRILGMLDMMKLKYTEVYPITWKSKFRLIVKRDKDKKETKAQLKRRAKEKSVATAMTLFPHVKFKTELGRLLDGRAEALLIAQYGRMIHEA